MANPKVVLDLVVDKPTLDDSEHQTWLDEHAHRQQGGLAEATYTPSGTGGQALTAQGFIANYKAELHGLQQAKPFFCQYASAGSLLGFASGTAGHVAMEGPGHPLAMLFRNGRLESELSDLAWESFGTKLTLDRLGDTRLRVGTVDVAVPLISSPTKEYADAVGSLPSLEEQGDGIKSFMGLALAVVAGSAQILLVDEPEAFLHPSQARALGRWLGKQAYERDIQVLLATHDRDLLLGLLDSGSEAAVTVARLTRSEGVNRLHHLGHEQVKTLWKDPVLRYSNVLQGLFHSRVAIAEGDADCRFYGAVLNRLGAKQDRRAIADDVLFVPSGGKGRVGAMAQALTNIGVETFAIVDFDVLQKKADLQSIVAGVGSAWVVEMQSDYVTVADAANATGGALWDVLKKNGLEGLPAGHVYNAGVSLLASLASHRVLVLPVGEMESFDKSCELHGAPWVSQILADGKHETLDGPSKLLQPLLD